MKKKKLIDPWPTFIKYLYQLGAIDLAGLDKELGKYFDYPKCCVDFFISIRKKTSKVSTYVNSIYGPDLNPTGYVRCPSCRKKR